MEITDKEIMEYLGHNGGSCRVRIKRTGEVERYGSPYPLDRSRDYWHFCGWRDHIVDEVLVRNSWLEEARNAPQA